MDGKGLAGGGDESEVKLQPPEMESQRRHGVRN